MRRILFFLFFILTYNSICAQQLTLIKDKESSYSIVISRKATPIEWQSAKVLQDYLQRIADCYLPIVMDSNKESVHEILIGHVRRQITRHVPYDSLGGDGLFIQTTDNKLILTGGNNKGILYAVYTFLDKYLGCKKLSSQVTIIPKRNEIVLNEIKDIELPAFPFRTTSYYDSKEPEYMDWHKLNSPYGSGSYNEKRRWGLRVHTFKILVDPKIYGKNHPEYFSFYNGSRHPGILPFGYEPGYRPESQLCLSNPDVLELVCKNLAKEMKKYPDAIYWSVSQNDNTNYCRCEKCMKLNRKYAAYSEKEKMIYDDKGNPLYSTVGMGSILWFVNKVAERFPDKIISTLAYTYSRTPPKGIKPRKNVNIMLCNIESYRNKPLVEDDQSFVSDLANWSKLTHNIYLWDYIVCFGNYSAPFPNLRTLQPNLQLFHNYGVSEMYEEANDAIGGEFPLLRAYLVSELMWNPNLDFRKKMNEFLKGYFGPAAEEIAEYIRIIHDNNKKANAELGIFDSPIDFKNSFLSEDLMKRYDSLFDVAYKKTIGSALYFHRVQSARLPIIFAELEIARDELIGSRGMFNQTNDGRLYLKPEIVKKFNEFLYLSHRDKVSTLTMLNISLKDYRKNYPWYFQLASDIPVNKKEINGVYRFNMKSAPKGYRDGYINLRKNKGKWTAFVMIGYVESPAGEVVVEENHCTMKVTISGYYPIVIRFDVNDGNISGITSYDSNLSFPIIASKIAE